MSRRSLGESLSLAQKAARGAGLPWGVADECGRAARWLVAKRLPLFPLADVLESHGTGGNVCGPDPDSFPLRGTEAGKLLCPLLAGALLCDEARLLSRDGGELRGVAFPVLLSPFVSRAAEEVGCAFCLRWPGAEVVLSPDGGCVARGGELLADSAERAEVVPAKETPDGEGGEGGDVVPLFPESDGGVWERLEELAGRTYVPSGEQSRARGAGPGEEDD